jgi:D-alanyl-D-alanine carboxypeptidase
VSSNVGPATNGGAGKTVRVSGRVTRSLRPAARPTQAVSAPFMLAVDTDLINSVLAEAVQVAAVAPTAITPAAREVVTRISTSGGRHWGVNVGRYNSRYEAEKALLRVALNEMSTLDGAVRRVTQNARGFDANFMGLTREGADLACRRLQARSQSCFMIGSEG